MRAVVRPALVRATLICIALILADPETAGAQGGPPPDADETVRETRERADSVERARADIEALERARRALDRAPDTPVSFADILKNPDDIALNFAYARQQVAQGRLKSAATTLERILLIVPELHEVRLFYALVLIRLDSLQSAARELDRLAELDMDPDLRAEVDALRAEISARRQRLTGSVLVGIGGAYDWNVNRVPTDRRVVFGGLPFRLTDQSDRVGDYSYIGFKRWEVAYDMGYQARHEAIGAATLYLNDQVTHDRQDIWSYSVEAGARLRAPDLTVTPKAFFSSLWLSHQRFLRTGGAEIDARYTLPPDTALLAGLKVTHESYSRISENRTAADDSGMRLEGDLGIEIDLDARNRIALSYGAYVKYGVYSHDHDWGHSLTGRYTRLFDGGVFASGSLELARKRDFKADPAVDPDRTREDATIRLGLRGGVPLGTVFDLSGAPPPVARALAPAIATLSAEAYRSMSSIRNYQYWNRRASVLLTRRWRF